MIFNGRSEKEIMLASQELRRIRQGHSKEFKVTAAKLAEFLESVEAEEALLEQRLRDTESRHLRTAHSTSIVDSPMSSMASGSAATPINTDRVLDVYEEM